LVSLVRSLWSDGASVGGLAPREAATSIAGALAERTGLSTRDRALLVFAAKLTLFPQGSRAEDLQTLRAEGLSERAVFDVVGLVCLFSFMNRLADGTGVVLDPQRHELARELLGEDALQAHLEWGRGPGAGDAG